MAQENQTETLAESTRFSLEVGMPMLVQFEGFEERVPILLVGMEKDAYLILRIPRAQKYQTQLYKGAPVLVRSVSEGNAFGFRAKVLGTIAAPFRLMFLEYPDNVETISLRKKTRVLCSIPAKAEIGGATFDGLISDISAAGVRIVLKRGDLLPPEDLGDNEPIKLTFPILGQAGVVEFTGIVKNANRQEDRVAFGVAFQDLPPEILTRIEEYVTTVLDYDL